MSEELADEVEAINSIYGEGALGPSADDDGVYVLRLPPGPDDSSASADASQSSPPSSSSSLLRLRFPASYPAQAPPAILGPHSAGSHGRRGAAARDAALFQDAVAVVFHPGQVCLFDALEEVVRLREEAVASADAATVEANEAEEGGLRESRFGNEPRLEDEAGAEGRDGDDDDILSGPAPPWTLSAPVTELKSTFVARCARASSPAQARRFLAHLLASDRRVRGATHNITAWRIRGDGGGGGAVVAYQDCDDDGETAAGGRLLRLMQLMDLWGAVVVVTRWYGGLKMGPRRFAVINQVARDAFVRAGLVGASSALPSASSSAKKK